MCILICLRGLLRQTSFCVYKGAGAAKGFAFPFGQRPKGSRGEPPPPKPLAPFHFGRLQSPFRAGEVEAVLPYGQLYQQKQQ